MSWAAVQTPWMGAVDNQTAILRAAINRHSADPEVLRFARTIAAPVAGADPATVATHVAGYVAQRVPYRGEKHETITPPLETVRSGGDCDDHAVLVGALLESLGLPCTIVILGTRSGNGRHVFIKAAGYDLDTTAATSQQWHAVPAMGGGEEDSADTSASYEAETFGDGSSSTDETPQELTADEQAAEEQAIAEYQYYTDTLGMSEEEYSAYLDMSEDEQAQYLVDGGFYSDPQAAKAAAETSSAEKAVGDVLKAAAQGAGKEFVKASMQELAKKYPGAGLSSGMTPKQALDKLKQVALEQHGKGVAKSAKGLAAGLANFAKENPLVAAIGAGLALGGLALAVRK